MSLQNKLMSVGQPAAMAQQTAGDVAATAVATGTTQADALPLSCAYNYVTTVDSGTGVRLYGQSARPSSIGDEQTVYNAGSNALNVYPPAGEQILGVIANAAFSIPTSSKLTFKKVTNTLWVASETFVQSGSGAVSTDVQTHLRSYAINAKTFAGCIGDGITDDTTPFSAAVSAALAAGKALYIPKGTYKVTSQLPAITGNFVMFGDGLNESLIRFDPTGAGSCIKLSNGASSCRYVALQDFGVVSFDTTYTKVAIDLYDVGDCYLQRIKIFGNGTAADSSLSCWSGNSNTSIGIRTHGREVTSVRDIYINADKPIYIDANPNSSATDGEDMDHWHWENLYLVANQNYCIEAAAGLGLMETTFDGYQAWVAGVGGIKINDTRAAPNVVSRGIVFRNVRTEQSQSAAGYAFNLTFTTPVQSLELDNILMSSTMNGITLTGFDGCIMNKVKATMSSTALVVAGVVARSVLEFHGCKWQSGSTVTLTGLSLIHAQAYRSAEYAAPQSAIYAGQIVDTSFEVASGTVTGTNGTSVFFVRGTSGDGVQVIPQAAGSGVAIRATNNGKTDFTPLALTFSTLDMRYRTGTGTSASMGTVGTIGNFAFSKRISAAQGIAVASANNVTLGDDGNRFQITGTTQINLLSSTNWVGGSRVTLHFQGIVTVKHNQTASGVNKPIFLKAAADLTTAAATQLVLQYDSTDSTWYQVN